MAPSVLKLTVAGNTSVLSDICHFLSPCRLTSFLPQGLCEEICGQVIGLFCVRQVMNGERKAQDPCLLGIVAQLYLYLTIGVGAGGIFIHEDVGIGRNCFPNIGKAGALL